MDGLCGLLLVFQQVADFCQQFFFVRRLWSGGGCGSGFLLLFCFGLACQAVDALYEQEHAEGYNNKVEEGLDEAAVVYGGGSQLLNAHVYGGQRELQVREVDTSDKPSYWRHDDVVDD